MERKALHQKWGDTVSLRGALSQIGDYELAAEASREAVQVDAVVDAVERFEREGESVPLLGIFELVDRSEQSDVVNGLESKDVLDSVIRVVFHFVNEENRLPAGRVNALDGPEPSELISSEVLFETEGIRDLLEIELTHVDQCLALALSKCAVHLDSSEDVDFVNQYNPLLVLEDLLRIGSLQLVLQIHHLQT